MSVGDWWLFHFGICIHGHSLQWSGWVGSVIHSRSGDSALPRWMAYVMLPCALGFDLAPRVVFHIPIEFLMEALSGFQYPCVAFSHRLSCSQPRQCTGLRVWFYSLELLLASTWCLYFLKNIKKSTTFLPNTDKVLHHGKSKHLQNSVTQQLYL